MPVIKIFRSEIARALKVGEEVLGARLEQTARLVIQGDELRFVVVDRSSIRCITRSIERNLSSK
jgi:hypothetical protein